MQETSEEVPVPVLGPDLFDPRQHALLAQQAGQVEENSESVEE